MKADQAPVAGPTETLAREVDALLPQTQCTKCGFDGCRPYAEAIAQGLADINRCPPGGATGIQKLARLTGRAARPLDPQCGEERPRRLAWIDDRYCIGCTLCIQACPVDAIIGAARGLHAVIADLCTGCDLCVPPCPVDCIEMRPLPMPAPWTNTDAEAARLRYQARAERMVREAQRRDISITLKAQAKLEHLRHEAEATPDKDHLAATEHKRQLIESVIAKARARLAR